jgi:hypothetical protein
VTVDEMGVTCSRNGEKEEFLLAISRKARRLEITRKTKMWMDLAEIVSGGVEWIGLALG